MRRPQRPHLTPSKVAPFGTARVVEADLDHVPPYLVSEYVPGPTCTTGSPGAASHAREPLDGLTTVGEPGLWGRRGWI
ncbi:hypothetical protein LO762_01510 [Actinocorallia sp. API 0066]|uniref:hypothetical protein n=1 Tax=Actinocorallia sp. API 0066 TaxID=2896846 RepID=UPI001E42D05F|nr:hypothetical protein [Actinocorallia sp. API 0066]MCD0447878.1 hypothetical protein [Actinocorallia sp. API 0066]